MSNLQPLQRYHRRVIQITAEHSPNVAHARLQESRGLEPTGLNDNGDDKCPGPLTWQEYQHRLATFDEVKASISLYARFWEGQSALMFPPDWLDRAERWAESNRGRSRRAIAMGCDPGEGVANTAWSIIDEYGLIDLVSQKTPDTNIIIARTIGLIERYHLDPRNVCFDRGGGGKQHVDTLRALGYPVWSVGFGESINQPPKGHKTIVPVVKKVDTIEDRYAYKNRRIEMYDRLRQFLDPAREQYAPQACTIHLPRTGDTTPLKDFVLKGFGLPGMYSDLRRQLAPLPILYDGESRMYLPPKTKPHPDFKGVTIEQLVGASPDESDSLVLALHAMCGRPKKSQAGAS